MIRVKNIDKSFNGKKVLDDISVTFEAGKTNLIIGRSGSGKTVLLKSIVGLHEIDKGEIWYEDILFNKLDFRRFQVDMEEALPMDDPAAIPILIDYGGSGPDVPEDRAVTINGDCRHFFDED